MADNYLEKKMDDYRRGVSKAPRRSHIVTPGRCRFVPEPQRLVLCLGNKELLQAILQEFQGVGGVKIAFGGVPSNEGQRLAQATGALFVPHAIGDEEGYGCVFDAVASRWGGTDTVITDIPDNITLPEGVRTIVISRCTNGADNRVKEDDALEISLPSGGIDVVKIARLIALLLTSPASIISAIRLKS